MDKRRRHFLRLRPRVDGLDERCLLSAYTMPSGYTPAQVTSAYGLNAITFATGGGTTVKGDGSGQTIALIEVDHDPNIQSDLATFDRKYGLADPPSFNVINQAGNETDGGWALEESLDVEWAHAIAPGANILVVEAAGGWTAQQELQSLMTAVNAASQTPGVVAISMSWGFGEFAGETSYDVNFTRPGITYIAAGGDSPGVLYPAASPNVLSVGGTTLNLDGAGNIVGESAWSDGGGGYSRFESEPGYQSSVQSTGQRSTPDVAFDGDPNTGVEVYATSLRTGQGSWQVVGGTSLGAPAWAGIIAIIDQGRTLAGRGPLTGATQTLPALYALAATDFHAIPGSSSAAQLGFWGGEFGGWNSGGTTTGATANTLTGLGTPSGSSMVNDLVASTTMAPLPSSVSVPSPSPIPTPTPSPAPTPAPTPSKHHHKKPVHIVHKTKPHAATSHAAKPVKPHVKSAKPKKGSTAHH